ncbi:MAG TPA: beta-phosphoglucomutase family hydrolase [Candidatus Dormibacteraeota bacterium]|nr:beta-phosphoglucomutase family hydrolase [Candidatus Dormibacteraeota bacterium]
MNRLGLPPQIAACLFDLDGVITRTAVQHARAWKEVFERHGIPFDDVKDYDAYVDGKPREDGVRSVLQARNIPATDALVEEIASEKDNLFLELIHREGVETYPGSVTYVEAARRLTLKVAVVSSSKHTSDVLRAAHLQDLFDAQVDGIVAEKEHLKGKPHPDTYLRAAEELGMTAAQAAVYEDALAGVEAGKAGRFGLVVGVDRAGQAEALQQHGADIVVKDLAELMS